MTIIVGYATDERGGAALDLGVMLSASGMVSRVARSTLRRNTSRGTPRPWPTMRPSNTSADVRCAIAHMRSSASLPSQSSWSAKNNVLPTLVKLSGP